MGARANPHPDLQPPHPGELLRDVVLVELGMPVTTAAKHLLVSRQSLHRILAGTAPITPEMAARIGKFCGNGPGVWLRMQANHDLWRAERRMADVLAKIPTIKAA